MRIGRANEFVSRSVLLFLLKLLGAVLGFLGSIFLGRNLGIAGLGQFEFVIALFNVVVILSFSGSGDALIKQVPRDSSYKRKLASLRYALRLRLTFFSRVALLVLAFFLLDTAFELGLSRFSYSMLAALILAIPFLYRDAMVSFMVALKENVLAQLFSDACSNAVRLAIFVGFFFLGNLYIGTALLAQVVAFFISSLFLFLALKKIFGVVSLRASNRLSLKFSAAAKDFWAASVFWHMMIYMDVLMLGVLVGDEAVGGYSVCLKVVQLLNYFVIVNNYIAGPQISEAFHNKKTVEIKGFVNTVILFMIFVATISVFLLSLFASDVLSFWGGGV